MSTDRYLLILILITTLIFNSLFQDEFYASLFIFASFEITCCVGVMEQIC